MQGLILSIVLLSSLAATVSFAANERQVRASGQQRLGLPSGAHFIFR